MPQEKTKYSDRHELLRLPLPASSPFAEQSNYALEMEISASTFKWQDLHKIFILVLYSNCIFY